MHISMYQALQQAQAVKVNADIKAIDAPAFATACNAQQLCQWTLVTEEGRGGLHYGQQHVHVRLV